MGLREFQASSAMRTFWIAVEWVKSRRGGRASTEELSVMVCNDLIGAFEHPVPSSVHVDHSQSVTPPFPR